MVLHLFFLFIRLDLTVSGTLFLPTLPIRQRYSSFFPFIVALVR